jgi:exopolysaccharide production protein ExoZ
MSFPSGADGDESPWPRQITPSSAGTAAHKNPSIQCLRGLAALSVALYHASVYSGRHFGESSWSSAFDGRFGLVGVAVFFALSGMLMADIIEQTNPWRFLAHRIVRIYPTYLLAVLIFAPIAAFLGGYGLSFHGLSLLLAPVGHRGYYLGVEWTLVFECTYYVALFLIAVAGWQCYLNWIVLAWLGLIGATSLLTGPDDSVLYSVHSIWLSAANVAFACGLLVPWIARKVRIPVGAGIVTMTAVIIALPADPTSARWAAGIAAAPLVFDAMRIKLPRSAMAGLPTLGDWSYALYLVHVPTLLAVYHFWPSSLSMGTAWTCAVAVSLVVAAGFGMVDVRMHRYVKRAVDSLEEKDRRRRVTVYVGVFIAASLAGMAV